MVNASDDDKYRITEEPVRSSIASSVGHIENMLKTGVAVQDYTFEHQKDSKRPEISHNDNNRTVNESQLIND